MPGRGGACRPSSPPDRRAGPRGRQQSGPHGHIDFEVRCCRRFASAWFADLAPAQTSPAILKGERVCPSSHVRAASAYHSDALDELSRPCPLAQVVGRTCARWSSFVHRRRCALRSPDPRGRVLDSALPYPSCGWVPASEPGSEDLPERRERRSARRFAHPLACPCPRPVPKATRANAHPVRLL